MPLLTTIELWKGVFLIPTFKIEMDRVSREISREDIDETIRRTFHGEHSNGLHFEQLHNSPVYSSRINQEHRILFVTCSKGGEKYLVPLEIVTNHDYKKALFRSRSILMTYLAKYCGLRVKVLNQHDYQIEITDENVVSLEDYFNQAMQTIESLPENGAYTNRENVRLHALDAYFYNQTFCHLSESQTASVQQIDQSKRGIIIGPPGSGKSLMALDRIRAHVQILERIIAQDNPDIDDVVKQICTTQLSHVFH